MEEILHQLRLVVYPINCRVLYMLYIPGGAGFLPSTVWNPLTTFCNPKLVPPGQVATTHQKLNQGQQGTHVLHSLIAIKNPFALHPWNLKMAPWRRRSLLESIILRFYVKLWGCIYYLYYMYLCGTSTCVTVLRPFNGRYQYQLDFKRRPTEMSYRFPVQTRWATSFKWSYGTPVNGIVNGYVTEDFHPNNKWSYGPLPITGDFPGPFWIIHGAPLINAHQKKYMGFIGMKL